MSWRGRPGSLPVFWQTLALLLLSLLVVQAVGVGLLFLLPPPRPDFNRLSDVSAALAGNAPHEEREQALTVSLASVPPPMPPGLTADPALARQLARRLGVGTAAVRLYGERERGPGFPFAHRTHRDPARWREPILFGSLVAAVAVEGGWRVASTPPPPLVAPWQRRVMLWFALSALALAPLAWSFARTISRQIRRFAEAADRLGADPRAPPLGEEGVAELRTAARAFNRMQGRLAEHVAERTAMIGAIAHDLRTPLARIAFRVEPAAEPIRERVLADVAQMQAMISATIGFVRSTGGPAERIRVDLAGLLRALGEQDRDLGRAVVLRGIDAATVLGDPIALQRLIQNLVDNALAYAGAVELALGVEGGRAVLLVADRGPGLPTELIERVFQPFARADPSRNRATGGIGLGLTIARAIAEDHGGTLTLANRDGGGLEAELRLPRV